MLFDGYPHTEDMIAGLVLATGIVLAGVAARRRVSFPGSRLEERIEGSPRRGLHLIANALIAAKWPLPIGIVSVAISSPSGTCSGSTSSIPGSGIPATRWRSRSCSPPGAPPTSSRALPGLRPQSPPAGRARGRYPHGRPRRGRRSVPDLVHRDPLPPDLPRTSRSPRSSPAPGSPGSRWRWRPRMSSRTSSAA